MLRNTAEAKSSGRVAKGSLLYGLTFQVNKQALT